MSSESKMQRLILRGAASEGGVVEEFEKYLTGFRNTYKEISNDDEKGAYLLAIATFALEQE